jgi:hypothetical protein
MSSRCVAYPLVFAPWPEPRPLSAGLLLRDGCRTAPFLHAVAIIRRVPKRVPSRESAHSPDPIFRSVNSPPEPSPSDGEIHGNHFPYGP